MKKIEDNGIEAARKRFIISIVILALAVAYLIFPIDFIPDVIFPAGYLDDIPMIVASAVYAGISYYQLKKKERARDRSEASISH